MIEMENMNIEDVKQIGKTNQKRYDMFVNAYSGMGGEHDPMRRFSFESGDELTQEDIEGLFRYNWIARRIIEAYAEDSVRQGIEIMVKNDKDKKIITNINGRLDELNAM